MMDSMCLHGCPVGVKGSIRECWRKKRARIERLLGRYTPDRRHLRLVVRRASYGFEVRAILSLPSGTLCAEATAQDPIHALDRLGDALATEVRRHKDIVRRERIHRRKARIQEDFRRYEGVLEANRQAERREAFFDMLAPVTRSLRELAHHELVLAQLEGRIRPRTVTVSDLLDEVVTRAWDRFASRPRGLSLHRWATAMLHEVLDEQMVEPPPVSISDRVRTDDPRYEADNGWVIENNALWEEPEPLTLDAVLPDVDAHEPWQELAAEEQRRRILDELRKAPPRQRRAFTLSVLEGWDDDEIATAQHRAPAEVRADIEDVRQTLHDSWLRADVMPALAAEAAS